jgi:hypothetical protein
VQIIEEVWIEGTKVMTTEVGLQHRWTDGRIDGWTDRRMDGWTDGQTDKLLRDGPAGYEFTRSFGSCELSPS